jgi:hypothetical protein
LQDTVIITYIVKGVSQVSLFLLPEEEDAKSFHQWGELIRDILQGLRAMLQRVEKLAVSICKLLGRDRLEHPLGRVREFYLVASIVRGSEEKDCKGGYEDGVEVLYVLRGSAGRVRQRLMGQG